MHQNEREILRAYKEEMEVWNDVDYAYIAHCLGDDYANDLRMAEKARLERERMLYEEQLQRALDFQRNELLEKLKGARQDCLLGLSVEGTELSHLLQISRAFVYSYFNNQVNKECEEVEGTDLQQ